MSGSRKRFAATPERAEAEEKWRLLSERQYTDGQLEVIDSKWMRKFNYLRTIKDREDFYVAVGAARRYRKDGPLAYVLDEKNPTHLLLERLEVAIKQWSAWRSRQFPQERVDAYEDMAAQMDGIGTRVEHHDDKGDFDIP